VANLHYQIFQMVGATRGNPHGFGDASGSNLPPPPPPPNMTPMETFLLAQADMTRTIWRTMRALSKVNSIIVKTNKTKTTPTISTLTHMKHI
jgi:hypothetical protein